MSNLKINFASRTIVRGKFFVKKSNFQPFTTGFCDKNIGYHQLKDEE